MVEGAFFSISNVQNQTEKYIIDLISGGEDLHTDFKFEISDSRKIARSISAFANTDGGRLLVGVKDNGKIAGVRSDEEYYMIQAAATLYTKPRYKMEYRNWKISGKTVLEVQIPRSKSGIVYAQDESQKWEPYIRIHDENQVAPSLLVKIWKKRNAGGILLKYSVAESQLLNMIAELKTVDRNQVKKQILLSDSEADEILSDLAILNAISYRMQDGRILFSISPAFCLEDYFRGC